MPHCVLLALPKLRNFRSCAFYIYPYTPPFPSNLFLYRQLCYNAHMLTRELDSKLELSNDGQLSFFFIGTGGAFSKKYFQNNLLIIKGSDHVLVDCGTLCPLALTAFNAKITDITTFLITHSHADHAGGLEEAALMNMYVTRRRPKMIITDEYKKILWEKTIKGGCGIRGEDGLPKYMTFDDYFEQVRPVPLTGTPRPMFEVTLGSLNLKLFRTKHLFLSTDTWENSFYSLGLVVDDRIVFTGDTKADFALVDWLTRDFNPEVIFHDGQMGTNAVHAGIAELKNFPAAIKNRMYLCHYGDADPAREDEIKALGFAGLAKRGVYYDF